MKINPLMLKTKRRGIASVVGIFFFFVFVMALLAALAISLENETSMIQTENTVANQLNKLRHENFTFSSPPAGVCIDPTNNRLFVEVDNIGSDHIEFADLWIVNKTTIANERVILNQINYSDSFNPFGTNSSVLLNQPIYLDAGTYDIKLVTTLGIMHTFSPLFIPSGTGDFLGAFVTAGSGGLDAPEGLIFHTDGKLYVSSEKSDEILRYNGITGAFIDVFADLNPGDGGSTCKKPLGIEFGPDGHLYIASEDKDVVCRVNGSSGAFINYFVTDGLGGLNHPADVTFGPDGNLYVTGEDQNKVYRYDGTTGAFMDVYSSTGLAKPKFLIFDSDGKLLVASESNDKVVRYKVSIGAFDVNFVDPSDNGGLSGPQGITFKP